MMNYDFMIDKDFCIPINHVNGKILLKVIEKGVVEGIFYFS